MAERPVHIIYAGAKVQIQLPVNLSLQDVENWIKSQPDFTLTLQQHGVQQKFSNTDILQFKYNSQNSQPALKKLTLDQYHPKKILIFYVRKVNNVNQSPNKVIQATIASQATIVNKVNPPVIPVIQNKPIIGSRQEIDSVNVSSKIQSQEQFNLITQLTFVQADDGKNSFKIAIKQKDTTIGQIEDIILKGTQVSTVKYTNSNGETLNFNKNQTIKELKGKYGLKNRQNIRFSLVRLAG